MEKILNLFISVPAMAPDDYFRIYDIYNFDDAINKIEFGLVVYELT